MTRFQYRPRTMEDVKKQAEQSAGNFDRIFKSEYDIFTAQDGENVVRFCPPTWEDAHHYAYEIWVHFGVGPRNGTYLCPKKMKNKKCPVCNAADDAARHGEKDDAAELSAKKRYVGWVLDRNSDTPKQPALWSHGWTLDKDINASLTDKRRGEILQIDDPYNGYDIIFQRTTGKDPRNTKYSGIHADRQETPLLDRQKDIDAVLEYIEDNPIPDTLKFYSADYLEDLIAGEAGEDDEPPFDEDDEEDDMKKPTSRTSSKRNDRDDDDLRRPVRGRARDDDADDRPVRGRAKDDDDDVPVRGARGRVKDDDDADDRPVRGRGRVKDDDDAAADDRRVVRGRKAADDDDDVPTRGRGRVKDDDDDVPTRGRGRVKDDEEDRPVRGRGKARDDEADDLPYDEEDDPEADSDHEAEEAARDAARSARGPARNGGTRGARAEREEETRPTRRPVPRESRSTKGSGRASRR